MQRSTWVVLLAMFFVGAASFPQPLPAQTCKDEEAMVKDYEQSIGDLVAKVKKENLTDFENEYRQKSCLTELTLCVSITDGLIACLDKESKESATPKEQADADRTMRDSYLKLKALMEQQRATLKATKDPKAAKALIEKLNLSS
jgi:hypothetical protein